MSNGEDEGEITVTLLRKDYILDDPSGRFALLTFDARNGSTIRIQTSNLEFATSLPIGHECGILDMGE